MKKDGFTLVELIAVIVILSLILTLSVPSLIGALKNNKEKSLEKINELIILAAKDYVIDYGLETPRDISLSELCKNYLDCPIINPVTNEEMNISVRVDVNKNYTIMNNQLIELKVVLNGGKLSKDISGGYAPNSEIILENPTRENYGFAGWEIVSGDAVIEGSILKLGTENSTIVANWVGTPVKLSVDLDGGVSNTTYNSEYYTRNLLDLGTPEKQNYMFVGWELISGDAVLSGNKLIFGHKDVSVKARWLKVIEEYAYTGSEQTFTAPLSGYYKLEVWGAQGGDGKTSMDYNQKGGYGGYSKGEVYLNENDKLYVVVGEQGKTGVGDGVSRVTVIGGYNGGANNLAGYSYSTDNYFGSGGGATHIATSSGLLSDLEDNKNSILIVAGGGGGSFYFLLQSYYHHSAGGSGGGYIGQDVQEYYSSSDTTGIYKATGGKQQVDSGNSYLIYGTFGKANAPTDNGLGGGGGGFYGGASGSGGGGGSGYIGNSLLTNKAMYCYNCTASSEEATKTISTTCTNKNATENCSKQGNGYAKITYLAE